MSFVQYFLYIYPVISIILTILFIILRCYYNFYSLDKYVFFTEEYLKDYLIYRITFYLLLGTIIGFDDLLYFMIRTIILEYALLYVNKCDYKQIDMNSGLYSICIGIISYILGSFVNLLFKSNININMTYLVYSYIIGSILLTLMFLVAKCYYNFHYLDSILYKNNNIGESNLVEYVLFHVVYYMILGYIFEFNGWKSSIVQTIIIEFLIAYVEKCDANNINWETGIYSIIIGLTSYFIGASIRFYMKKKNKFY